MNLHTLHNDTLQRWHGRSHYEYQDRFVKAVLQAVEQSKKGTETFEIPAMFPRQAGKTTAVVDTTEFLLASARRYLGRPLAIGIFAPQKEQATTDFDRLKQQFAEVPSLGFRTKASYDKEGDALKFPEKWNSKAIRLYTAQSKFLGEVYIFPVGPTSNPESKTLDIIICEESQQMPDERLKNAVFPMGAATNAVRVHIGTAGYKLCNFKRLMDSHPRRIKVTLDEVFAQRRATYELTGDPVHLLYEQYVNYEIANEPGGRNSEYIRTQFLLEWVIGSGQFTTSEKLDAMIGEYELMDVAPEGATIYIGIDTAKQPDHTIGTAIATHPNWKKPRLISWLDLVGDNYEDQFTYITGWIAKLCEKGAYVRVIGLDATGQGDFMPDKFERHTGYNIVRVKFTAEMKDTIYKILLQTIENKMTELPNSTGSYMQAFRQQMLELEKEYKGRFMAVHHPDNSKAHDDYPDSWAIAEYVKAEIERNAPRLSFL